MSQTLPERRSTTEPQRWEPLSELEQMTQRMRRMLDQTFGGFGLQSPLITEGAGWAPLVDIEDRCQRHGLPAVASRVRLRPDGTQETEYLCELDLAEERMSSRLGGSSLFDEFFSDFFGQTPSTGRVAPPARQVERVDVTQFFSDATRELLQRAAQTALEWGSLDLDSDHLLYAALRDDLVRHVLEQIDADPDAIAAQVEEEAERAQRTDVAPSLSPDATAALLAA